MLQRKRNKICCSPAHLRAGYIRCYSKPKIPEFETAQANLYWNIKMYMLRRCPRWIFPLVNGIHEQIDWITEYIQKWFCRRGMQKSNLSIQHRYRRDLEPAYYQKRFLDHSNQRSTPLKVPLKGRSGSLPRSSQPSYITRTAPVCAQGSWKNETVSEPTPGDNGAKSLGRKLRKVNGKGLTERTAGWSTVEWVMVAVKMGI